MNNFSKVEKKCTRTSFLLSNFGFSRIISSEHCRDLSFIANKANEYEKLTKNELHSKKLNLLVIAKNLRETVTSNQMDAGLNLI